MMMYMSKLRKLAVRVDSENTSTQDVTEEFVDLDARLKVLNAEQQQLLSFLQRTQSVDESLKVYRELTSVQSQIESIKGRMNYLQKSAAMSTISVNLRPEEAPSPSCLSKDGSHSVSSAALCAPLCRPCRLSSPWPSTLLVVIAA